MTQIEWIDNLDLLADNVRHLRFELQQAKPNWFRVAKEAYHTLCRTMVEACRGSANLEITGRRRDKRRTVHYHLGDTTLKTVQKESVPGCDKAWRYSKPVKAKEPVSLAASERERKPDEQLVDFFDLLAMIQAEWIMSRSVVSAPVTVADPYMKSLEWLHVSIRNEFEHFMPKLYGATATELQQASRVALDLVVRLIEEGGTIILLDGNQAIIPAIAEARQLLAQEMPGGTPGAA